MPEDRLTKIENEIKELRDMITRNNSGEQINPDLLEAIIKRTEATPTGGYDGRFLINGKYVDYIDP